jgi:cytochrome c oxidase subunit 2
MVVVTSTGCSAEEVLRFGWPVGITPQAEEMRRLWTWSVVAALVVGAIVWGLILWSVVFHRKRKDRDELPQQFQYNLPLEIVYTVIPLVIIGVLFYYAAVAQNMVNGKDEPADLNVQVVSFQWNWEFRYTDKKNAAGQVINTVGSPGEIPLLVIPKDRTVRYTIMSKDVIHSFFVPAWNFKRDTFPHPDRNGQDNVFQNTVDREGSFVGRCAELCGTYHSMMNFEVRALSPERFEKYITLRAAINPVTRAPNTAAEALDRMGKDDPSCGDLCKPQATTTSTFKTDRTAREANNR